MQTQSENLRGDVRALLRYLRPADQKDGPVQPGWPGGLEECEVAIRDARPAADRLDLDREGFILRPHHSAVANFYDADEVRARYYPELERLVKTTTGAAKVVVFAHDVRCAPKAGTAGVREPVKAVHNDYTPISGPQFVNEMLPPTEAAARLERRFIELNLWRPIRGPVMDMPLAICDAASIASRDLVVVELKHEVFMLHYNPEHRWFYFPLMEPGEVIFIKGYDSSEDGCARFTAHSAFAHPRSPADAPARESIETRLLAFF